jgi:lipid II:glycine glycyltransferase (peptidoglycan interpeptide bridge formation enzyme)
MLRQLEAICLDQEQRERWNDFVCQESCFSLLQSWEWGAFKEKLGWKTVRIAVQHEGQILAGAQMLIKTLPIQLPCLAYIPYGPLGLLDDDEVAHTLFSAIGQVARHHRAALLHIELQSECCPSLDQMILAQGFRPSKYNNQPRATIKLDLTPDLDQIMAQMRKKTRQYIRGAIRDGVTVRQGTASDLPAFFSLMQATARRAGFTPRRLEYYQHEWQTFSPDHRGLFLLAYHQAKLLAGRIIFRCGPHAAEFHGASCEENSDLHPNYLLVWEAIQWAKAQGCQTYDFWGIPDEAGQAIYEGMTPPQETRRDGLWGVYQFKRGFSEHVVYYQGAYDQVYSKPIDYLLNSKIAKSDVLDKVAAWMDLIKRPTRA